MYVHELAQVKTIVVHDNCPDGVASAILLHDSLPQAEIRFMQHNTDALKALVPEPGYLFCDFVPYVPTKTVDGVLKNDLDALKPWIDAGTLVLDHHKGVQDVVEAFGPKRGHFGNEKTEPGVCGAVLAFRHVWRLVNPVEDATDTVAIEEQKRAEEFATLAGVRDTWLNTHPWWRDACAQAEMLRFYPVEHWLSIGSPFSSAMVPIWEERRAIGRLLIERMEKSVQKTIESAYRFTSAKGTKVVTFDGLKTTSDAAEALGTEADLIIGFSYIVENGTPKMLLSTRSHTDFDCLAFAKSNGGGGHTRAAGFNRAVVPHDLNPYKMVEQLVLWYESAQ
jgi:hypothetical protein